MPRISNLIILLPCHSLDDFPIHHRGNDAANLLANWTALWHPALIASAMQIPEFHPADDSELNWRPEFDFHETASDHSETIAPESNTPESNTPATFASEQSDPAAESTDRPLILIPQISDPIVSSPLLMQLADQNAIVISDHLSRCDIVARAFASSSHTQGLAEKVEPEMANDFFALGYAFLQTQIMTRQLRYSSNLDETFFSHKLVEASIAATEGNSKAAIKHLTKCFDLLLEEKNNYYPVDPELCDVVLTAPTTLGASLIRQLDEKHPWSVLLTGKNAKAMLGAKPESARRLVDAISERQVTVVGGLEDELPFPLMSSESNINQLTAGRETFRSLWNVTPKVYMRRKFGMTPSVPGLLDQFGFIGAILATLDDGEFPTSPNCSIRWNGDDDRSVLAFGTMPLNASDSGSFVGLGVRLGEAIDSAHMACFVFVHWPGDWCESFSDLIRCSKYGELFGQFTGLDESFDSRYDPGFGETYTADEFRSPYLKQAIESGASDPVSRWTNYWRRFYELASLRSLPIMIGARTRLLSEDATRIQSEIDSIQTAIESTMSDDEDEDVTIDSRMTQLQQELVARLSESTNPGPTDSFTDQRQTAQPRTLRMGKGVVDLINTTSFKRIVSYTGMASQTGTIKKQPPFVRCDSDGDGACWVVEIPPMGSVRIDPAEVESKDHFRTDPGVVEERLLRNEFFEVQIDETTGGIQRIQTYTKRGNTVGQQLAMRIPGEKRSNESPLRQARYTQMVADSIQQISHSRLSGSVIASGRLMDGESVVADFTQTIRVTRGQRVIDVQIDLEPRVDLTPSINHYLCSRLAWKDESATVQANAQESKYPISADWFHATHFVEIKDDHYPVTLLTGGLPYHRRASRRMLDSLLIVGNEPQRRFRFGIAVDAPYAMATAVDWMTPLIETVPPIDGMGERGANWLFHFDSKNILMTWWEPEFNENSDWSGIRIRLRETEGRSGKLRIRCPRVIAAAERVSFGGDYLHSLDVAEDDASKLEVEFVRYDFFEVSIHWKI